jgi:tape measure domain-containing protein
VATSIGNLNVKLTAGLSGFARGMQRGGGYVDTLQNKVGGLTSKIGKLATVGGALLGAGGLLAGLGTGVKLAAEYEQAGVAMATMIGSASKAEAVLADLNDFAASTPFEMPGLTDATKKLLAFGSTPDAVIGELRMLGDIAAGIGQPVDQLAELYGKARVSGRLFAEDVNQLTGRGIPIIAALAKQFGVADAEVKSLVQSGRVNFGHLQAALQDLTADGSQFGGMMAAQSQTLAGRWSTLRDNVGLALRDLARAGIETFNVTGAIEGLTVAIQHNITPMIQWAGANGDTIRTLAVMVPSIYATSKALALFNATLATTKTLAVGSAIYAGLGRIAMAIAFYGGVIPAAVAGLKALAVSTLALKAATLGAVAVFGTITAAFVKSRIEGKRYSDTVWEMGRSLGIFDSAAARLTDAYEDISDAADAVGAAERAMEAAKNDAARLTAAQDYATALEQQIKARKAMLKMEGESVGDDLLTNKLQQRLDAAQAGIERMQAAAQTASLAPLTTQLDAAGDAAANAQRDLDNFAASVYTATRSPAEAFGDDFAKLEQALAAGAFDSMDTAKRGLHAALDDAIGGASTDQLQNLARDLHALAIAGRIDHTTYEALFSKVADAIDQPAEKMRELAAAGAAVYDATRTPAEQHRAELAKLQKMLDAGIIGWTTYQRAVDQAGQKLADSSNAAGRAVFEATRTPLEKYEAELDKLSDLLNNGSIDWQTYGRAVQKARGELESAADAAQATRAEALRIGSADAQLASFQRQMEAVTIIDASMPDIAYAAAPAAPTRPDAQAGGNAPAMPPMGEGLRQLRDDLSQKQLAEAEEQTRTLDRIERNTRTTSNNVTTIDIVSI